MTETTRGTAERGLGRAPWLIRTQHVEGAPVVAVRFWLRGGARLEAIPGQALITGRMLSEGTRRRDWRRIATDAESKGMILSSFGYFEHYGLSIDALAKDWEQALDWAAEMVLEPSFPEDRSAWLARQAAAELESLADQPDVKTAWGFLEQLYTPHPRSRPLQGSVESLGKLTAADCAEHHRRSLRQGLLVSVAGVIDEDAVRKRLEGLLSGLPAEIEPLPEPPAPVGFREKRHEVETGAEDQAHLYVGHRTVKRDHPDYAALELLAVVLGAGSGLTGRIPARIREKEGLAYTAQAQTVSGSGLDQGRLIAYVGTSPATVDQAERGVIEEIAKLVDEGITDQELDEARAYLLGREPFLRETARQWADLLMEAELYGLPLDRPAWRTAELTSPDRKTVEEAARRHIDVAALQVTVGYPEEE
ncbi:MAG TPA: pitrilysin family protein [Thermoanaerobaculia bacterium]|nr:pitrilysin family protein [Thermoanaerobaculia bacterium]